MNFIHVFPDFSKKIPASFDKSVTGYFILQGSYKFQETRLEHNVVVQFAVFLCGQLRDIIGGVTDRYPCCLQHFGCLIVCHCRFGICCISADNTIPVHMDLCHINRRIDLCLPADTMIGI